VIRTALGALLALPALLLSALPAAAQEDHSGLTRAKFVRNCLMCHSRAAPEGVAPEIMAGLLPQRGLRPVDAMPGIVCWRRCDSCFAPERTAKR
jgi:hypothetical protein